MAAIRIVTEADLRAAVPLDLDAVTCVQEAFARLSQGGVVMPPILRLDIEDANGEVDVKTAYVPGLDGFAIKISPGFFDNPKLGLPSVNGLMCLFSAKTGLLQAVFLDNGYLTDVRTAAAGAVAARHLARADARRAAILGAGVQAGLQLKALTLVRPIDSAVIWARDATKAYSRAAELSDDLGLPVTAAPEAREAVEGADIIVLTTPSPTPILSADWLETGQHVTAMGSDAEHKNELDPAAIRRADLYVADSLDQTRRLGELHHAVTAGLIGPDESFPELGTIITGTGAGRTDASQITIADLTGTGVQDTAIATLANQRVLEAGTGAAFES